MAPLAKIDRVRRITLLTPFLLFFFSTLQPACADSSKDQFGDVAFRVASILESEHYNREPFRDDMSAKVLDTFLEILDFRRVYFTQSDIDGFNAKYRTSIDDSLKDQGIPAATEIYGICLERVKARLEYAEKVLAEEDFTFDSARTVRMTRKDAPWPKNEEEQRQLWRNLIEEELLRDQLAAEAAAAAAAEKGEEPKERKDPKEKILKRLTDFYQELVDNDREDVATFFIKSIARAYDPHSEYYSRKQYENFKISMNKKLRGIGAMLQLDDEEIPTVKGLVVGGPAWKAGELKDLDKIIGVGQGDEEIVDVIGKKLSDTVDLIRGDIGTTATLLVRPASATDPSETKVIKIVRDQVDLKDSLANADLIETTDRDGKKQKIGWIRLSSFYADMDGGETSTTEDVRRLVSRLRQEGMDGLAIDLRDNGGGSLEEAVNMTGLFIKRGPVVQAQKWNGHRTKKESTSPRPLWSGPMVVLTNRASASASEIFAAALQDYNRAIIIGEKSTFGKGTVQQLRPVLGRRLNIFNRNPDQRGALKLTIQTFFRINGESTQLTGVIPDLQLPSIYDVEDFGEASLSNPLKVDPIPRAQYELFSDDELPIDILRKAMEPRVASDKDFGYIMDDIAEEKLRLKENKISLNKEQRQNEMKLNKEEAEVRKQERIARYEQQRGEEEGLFEIRTITQDNWNKSGRPPLKAEISSEALSGMTRSEEKEDDEEEKERKKLEYPHLLDPYERESIRILQDFIWVHEKKKSLDVSTATPIAEARKVTPVPVANP